jgi:4-alpha-glucanotransferase
MTRGAGVLLHPTCLPGPHGIGDLGSAAHRFLDSLHGAGQSYWQVLPLGPTGYGDSPYQALSAFAGNPLLVAPDALAEDGLLSPEEAVPPGGTASTVDFGAVIPRKRALLARAHDAFRRRQPGPLEEGWRAFRAAETWLDDYALFAALHDERQAAWPAWPAPLRDREPAALREARERLAPAIERIAFSQFLFFRQWGALRTAAAARGVKLFGDLPLFVAHDSADVWAHRELFDLDAEGRPNRLSGAPPDMFTDDGQLWGNPLYRWDVLEARDFDWWVARARATLGLFDLVRLDHFRGFCACWTVPAGEATARNGRWEEVPGKALLSALRVTLGGLPFVAEDLGVITPDVVELRERFGFPGMKVLLFAFGGDPGTSEYLPHNHGRDFVVYTGTHDNETVQGWFRDGIFTSVVRPREEAEAERRRVLDYAGGDEASIHEAFVRLAMTSVADTAIIPVQDLLGLGNEARMNVPGRPAGNWTWRLAEGQWSEEASERLARISRAAGRHRADVPPAPAAG